MNSDIKEKSTVGFGRLFLWQSRSISQAINVLLLTFFTLYATDVVGLAPGVVGTILLISKLFDGFSDTFAGFIVDNTRTRFGKGRPYEVMIIGMWLCTWLLFSTPLAMSTTMKITWVFVMYTLINSLFVTFLNANNVVYLVRAFKKQEDYVRISSLGFIFVIAGSIVFNVLFPVLVAKAGTDASAWSQLILMISVPMTIIGLIRFLTCPEVSEVTDESVDTHEDKVKLKDVMMLLKSNKYVYIIAILGFVNAIVANMGVAAYYFKYIVGDIALMGLVALSTVIVLPVMFIFPMLLRRTSARNLVLVGLFIACIGFLINYIAVDNIILLMIGSVVSGAGVLPINMLIPLFIIEISNYNAINSIPKMEGTISSVQSFAVKIGSSLGVILVGYLLGMAGYDGTSTTISDSAYTMIRLLYSLIPLLLYVLTALTLFKYDLAKVLANHKLNEEQK